MKNCRIMKIIQELLDKYYRYLGRSIARHPLYFLIIPLFITFLLSFGISRISYRREMNSLFTPSSGRSVKERELALKYFSLNLSTEYDLSRLIDAGRNYIFIVTSTDGKSVLREHIYEEIRLLNKIVQNFSIRWKDKDVNYSQICVTNYDKCVENFGLLDNNTVTNFRKGLFSIKYPVEINPETYKVTPYALNFGGVTTDEQGYIKEALAYRLFYAIDFERNSYEETNQWEISALKKFQVLKFRYINVVMSTSDYGQYSKQYSDKMITLGSISVTTILVFCVLSCMTTNCVRSKPWLGLSAFVSAVLAIISCFGTVILFGVSYIDLNSALPFLMIGMGIDDSFVLLAAWRRCISFKNIESRMENTYSEVALSITITSLTNMISFMAGIFPPSPAISIFCTYATVGICFTFLYQMTFFGSCLVLTGYREHNGLNPFTFQRVITGIQDNKKISEKEHIMNFLGNKIGGYITKLPVKLIIIMISISCLGVGIKGITQIKIGLDTTEILPAGSLGHKFTVLNNKYFSKYSHRIHIIINSPLNYADMSVQHQIENALKKFEENPLISGTDFTESWLRAYLMFATSHVSKFTLGAFNISDKQDFIDGLRIFMKFPQTRNFQRDVIFNDNYTEIIASRFFVMCDDVKDKTEEKMLIENMWYIADHSDIPINVFSYWFTFYEQLVGIKPVAIQTILIAVIAIITIFLCLISNAICCICVAISIIFVIIEVFGFMAIWGVNLDIFSLINLIMCIGFCINYPAHVTYAYITSTHTELDEKLQSSLYAMGLPILQGSLSTLIGVSVLVMDSSYMFSVFVKVVLLVVVLTALHSFFFVPVILDICHRYYRCNTYEEQLRKKNILNEPF